MKKGTPSYKPIIIRGSLDSWTIQGEVAEHYKSDISSYLAHFIKTIDEIYHNQNKDIKFPIRVNNSLIEKNIKSIQLYLEQVISVISY